MLSAIIKVMVGALVSIFDILLAMAFDSSIILEFFGRLGLGYSLKVMSPPQKLLALYV